MLAIKWLNKLKRHISIKIFILTAGLILVFTVLVYTLLIFFFPHFYSHYKINLIHKKANDIVEVSKSGGIEAVKEKMDEFLKETNLTPVLTDSKGNLVYIPKIGVKLDDQSPAQVKLNPTFDNSANKSLTVAAIQPVNYKKCFLSYQVSVHPINDVSNVLFEFAPFFAISGLILSLLAAWFFSKMTVKPLLRINGVATKMANLDFSEVIPVKSKDEIGQISKNLNNLALTLEKTMAELHKANEQLIADIEKERKIEENRKNFIIALSHELKSPLAAVMGQIEAMQHNIPPYDDHSKYLKESYAIMDKMSSMIQQMIMISKIEQSESPFTVDNFSLSNLLQEVVAEKKRMLSPPVKELSCQVAPTIFITANKEITRKIIENVIENAFRYTTGKVRIELTQGRNLFDLIVYNTANKISESELKKIFQPFYRLEKSGNKKTGGSGLGLFITSKLLDTQGFHYQLSNKDQGILFRIWK